MLIFFGFIILGFLLVVSALGFMIIKYNLNQFYGMDCQNGAHKDSLYKSIEKK